MKRISDYMLVTDMDGTLLGHDGEIPKRNVEAIHRFVEKGGRFGIATGRSRALMLEKAGKLPISGPCVLYNGGALYDFGTDKMLAEVFLPEAAAGYIRDIIGEMPDIGSMVISGDDYFQVKLEQKFASFLDTRDPSHFHACPVEQVPFPWYKILIQYTEDRYGFFQSLVDGKAYAGVRFVCTNSTMAEMLPLGVSKATALESAIDLGLVKRENLVTIGDFYNDLEMIEMAGMGVTLRTSPQDIQDKSDLVVGDCDSGAVADLIEHLERLCGEA